MLTAALLASLLVTAPASLDWTIVDVGRQQAYDVPDNVARLTTGGTINAKPAGADLAMTVTCQPGEPVTRLRVHLADQSGQDRGLVVRLTIGLDGDGWRWWHDLDTAEALGAKPLSDTAGLRGLPGLPFFENAERPEFGRYSVYPLGVVDDGAAWIGLARPMAPVAIMRFAATGGDEPVLTAEVDLALAGATKPPREAEFELWVLTGSNAAGPAMRQALADTYAADPAAWQVRSELYGQWMPFLDLAKLPNVDEFGFAFQEGAPNTAFDDALGARSFIYFHCAGEFANVPGYQRGSEPQPPYEQVIAAFDQVAERHSGVPKVWEQAGIHGPDGKVDYRPEKTYGDFFCQACVDPDLPYGAQMIERLVSRVLAQPSPTGIDGVYYDGIAAGLDYDPRHLAAADHLLLWDAKLGRPLNYNLFSSAEWAAAIHDRLVGTGKLTMLNDSSLSSFPFVGPSIDVLGGEISIHLPRTQRRIVRALCGNKPFCALVKADYTKVSQAAIETFMRRCVAYAMLPGFFDITPSGDHPGSSYWLHPEWYDRDRALFRRYLPLASELAKAGWQAVPGAVVEGAAFLEAFGDGPVRYLAVSTDPAEDLSLRTPFTIRTAFARPGDVAVELLTGQTVADAREITGYLSPEDLSVWAIGQPAALATAAQARAGELLDARQRYLAASQQRSAGLSPWTPYGQGGATIAAGGADGSQALRIERRQRQDYAGATQTISLQATAPRPLRVTAQGRVEQVTCVKDRDLGVYVDCYYTDGSAIYGQTAPLDPAATGWQMLTVEIQPAKPVRNVNVYLLMRGNHHGVVWLDGVSVVETAAPDQELLKRGDFESAGAMPLVGDSPAAADINRAFDQLRGTLAEPAACKLLLSTIEQTAETANWGADTERTLRDVEDLRWQLTLGATALAARDRGPIRDSRLTPNEALSDSSPRPQPAAVRRYTASSGRVPRGTVITVDSNFDGYRADVLTDGKVNPADVHWTDVAWASADQPAEHWITLQFPQPLAARKVTVWWAKDNGQLMASATLEVQVPDGEGWRTVATGKPSGEATGVELDGSAVKALRLRQPAGGGSRERPNLMWASELAVD